MTTKKITSYRVGCSGFHYPDWKDIFYPKTLPQRKWFEFYCSKFNTLELNVTFYRFPQLKFMQTWYDQSPPGFNFSVKVPRAVTHYRQFNNTDEMLSDFYGTCMEGLREKLGCILFQLPGRTKFNQERLEKMIAAVDPRFKNVFEFRHESWWRQGVYTQLRKANIIFCGHSYPDLPDPLIKNNEIIYYRFHGTPKVYYSQYKRIFLDNILQQAAIKRNVECTYLYFNNTATMAAIRNAGYVLKQLS